MTPSRPFFPTFFPEPPLESGALGFDFGELGEEQAPVVTRGEERSFATAAAVVPSKIMNLRFDVRSRDLLVVRVAVEMGKHSQEYLFQGEIPASFFVEGPEGAQSIVRLKPRTLSIGQRAIVTVRNRTRRALPFLAVFETLEAR